jgi:hypothetical protein
MGDTDFIDYRDSPNKTTAMRWGKMGLEEILSDLGEPIGLCGDENKIYLQFENGRVLQLHDDEIENQAEDFLNREIDWLGKD